MDSSPRNLILACSIALAGLLPTGLAFGQANYGPSGIIDHSSMSPDSWSTPETTNPPAASVASRTVLSSTVLPNTPAGGRPVAAYQPSSSKPMMPAGLQQTSSTPTIPDLSNTAGRQATNRIRSLIRQPETNVGTAVLTGTPKNAGQPTYKVARYNLGSQNNLPSAGSAPLSNTTLLGAGNQSTLPGEIISATGRFDAEPGG